MSRLYTDGGQAIKNPSLYVGSWCWILVDDDDETVIKTGSGTITPEQLNYPYVSNNTVELLAVIDAFEKLPVGSVKSIHTDSRVTLYRITTDKPKVNGLTPGVIYRLAQVRKLLTGVPVNLLGGHPSKKDLAKGFRPDGKPVSKHNVACDLKCRELCAEFMTEYYKTNDPITNRFKIN